MSIKYANTGTLSVCNMRTKVYQICQYTVQKHCQSTVLLYVIQVYQIYVNTGILSISSNHTARHYHYQHYWAIVWWACFQQTVGIYTGTLCAHIGDFQEKRKEASPNL